ncbi:ATP-dependent DNA helicase recQ [Xylaria nigripes]|nr:ATP-dependent DNA helicase recQ [Xylaria nigripes]
MSDYGSGDELLDGVDVDELLRAGSKRANPHDHDPDTQSPNKRVNTKTPPCDQYDIVARSILKQKFGYDEFRHKQAAAIRAILKGENAMVVFPTGAGKSLCYQIPGLAFEELDTAGLTERHSESASTGSGITIVVSPLIALMKDQVDALHRRGIPAACMDSTKSRTEMIEINASMQQGRLRILYCAPERLNNEMFVDNIKFVPGGIRLVAVDEAHCISEWGHSFRPDYLKVARFVSEIQAERVICLTATATTRVAEDVRKAFNISESNMFRTPVYRSNLQLRAEVTILPEHKFPRLLQFLKDHNGPTLVYVTTQKNSEDLANLLAKKGHNAAAFHSGLDSGMKSRIQDAYMAGKIRIVVATIAFGMGIDKADIRNVVHYDVSNSIEEYSQQVGRAGRDGKPSFCTTYLCRNDFWVKETYIRGDLPSRQSLRKLLNDLFLSQPTVEDRDGSKVLKLRLGELSKTHDIRVSPLTIILATLELRHGIFRAITPEYSSYRFTATPSYATRIGRDSSVEAKAIFRFASKAVKRYTIDPNAIEALTGQPRENIIRKLRGLNDEGVIVLDASGVVNRYKLLKTPPTTPQEVDKIADQLYVEMEGREADAMKRFNGACDLLTGEQCFALALSKYFGMSLPDGMLKCRNCTNCLTGKPVVLPPKKVPPINEAKIKDILALCDVRDDPRFLARLAFGIKSPRITRLKLDKTAVFGSMENHDFKSLLNAFAKACNVQD